MQPLQEAPTAALLGGRYQLGECIGEGGMSHVYRAEDVWLGRTVAVKLMRGDTDVVDSPVRVRTEMTVLATLDHPSLVKLLDSSIEQGRPQYLVMEFVDGTNLAERINGGPLPPAEVAHLAGALASALHAVHQAGVVHRDLKPSNVLVESSPEPGIRPRVKLADFGVAYLMDSTRVTTPGMIIGTAAYLAPEQVRGEAIAPPADIYALGLVLLEALTGERAFPTASGVGALMARLIDSPTVPEWVGPAWAQLLSRMTATDPAQRPTAFEVAQAATRLPTRIRPSSAPAEPAETQPSFLPPAEAHPPTRHIAGPTDSAVPAPRAIRRRALRTGAVAMMASLATAVALGVTASVWPTAVDAATDSPGSGVIVEPLRMDVESGTASIEPAADTGPAAAVPAPPTPASDVETKRADEARKAAERAQREAERAQRDAAKQQSQSERESAKKPNGG